MKEIAALISGLIFSLGLILSGMTNPANIISFLDVTGNWNPALAFVLMAAVVVTGLGYRLAWKRSKPLFETSFSVPTSQIIDKRLIVGSAIFGIGWGLVGLCPGERFYFKWCQSARVYCSGGRRYFTSTTPDFPN